MITALGLALSLVKPKDNHGGIIKTGERTLLLQRYQLS